PNRNANTRNINNGASADILFYVATTIDVNAFLGQNSTPILLNAPLDSGRVGQKFCYNPAAFDVDGDSLAYRTVTPAQGFLNNPCQQVAVPNYRLPTVFSTTNEAGGAPTYTVNAITGDLCWDAPGQIGQYNMAFIIEEWRNGVLIGEITVDLQLIVEDSPNRRPLLQVPPELCVEAGTTIDQVIRATDPDGNRVTITAFGGPFNRGADGRPSVPALVAPNPATFTTPTQAQPQPGSGTFSWQTNCNHVREEPYDVIFKVTDSPTNRAFSLATFQSLRITVYGASPQNLTARPTASAGGRAIQLNWTPYTCVPASTSAQPTTDVTRIIVYRKEGCTSPNNLSCTTGVPAGQGYVRIGTVPYTTSTFTDTLSLRRGVSYSYRIVAQYPQGTGGGASVASEQFCYSLPSLAPLLTNVTVDSTGAGLTPAVGRGVITVRWTRPLGLNPGDLGAPYQYRLLRAEGNGTTFTNVLTRPTALDPAVADTVFTDRTGLNTVANAYTYRLEFYYTDPTGQLTRFDTSDPASSVRLTATPANRRIQLGWQATTPWSNDNQTHRVYRSTTGPNGPFNQIADVGVTNPASFTFTDTGIDNITADGNTSLPALSADSSYCYRVETVGRYTDAGASLGPLLNFSQIVCAQPADTTRPCPPVLRVDSLNCASLSPESLCNQTTFRNVLNWVNGTGPTCDPNIAGYNIYYSRYPDEPVSATLASVSAPTLTFSHESLTSLAGCYQVTAVSRRGLESAPSNRVCVDNCPSFTMPNVFTPNGDGVNDLFVPLSCPRFVESVVFVVVNRWGAEVYRTGDVGINWNGNASNGQPLPGGLYYYQATVRFASLARNAPPVVYKGWVELIRQAGISSGR
ncbi:MAG: gliding motility-associated C-terminal domain-containing protein, partial [Bacteroidetes bacterium]|nr:gliding motility-associated C-terminal domain-containing protein [Fibrella sp.]